MKARVSRRQVLKGGAAVAGALALGRTLPAGESEPAERPTLVVFWLNGGPAGLFNSADSFLRSGAFGVGSDKGALPVHGMDEPFVAKHSDRSARRGACYAELSLDVRLAGHRIASGLALQVSDPSP